MANTFHQRMFTTLEAYWHGLPRPYRTPVLLTTCTALVFTPFIWRRLTYKPDLLSPAPADYKYRVANIEDSSSTFTLPDGRKIGYAQYGDPNGKPMIVLHGILGSRLENALFDDNAKDLGVRIIGLDRPGIGLSAPDTRPVKERKVLDHSKEVEALAEHLQLQSYAIIGNSGGGPYALGCARALPSSPSKPTLQAVAIVTGQGLPDMSQPWPVILVFLNKNLNLRWLLKIMFGRAPEWNVALSDEERAEIMRRSFDLKGAHPADIGTARLPKYPDMVRIFLRSSRQAIAHGWEAFLDDAEVIAADPGFRVEDIRADLPVHLWYGTDDKNISPQAGVETAERLRAAGNERVELHMQEGETHGSTQVKYQRQLLVDLLRAMDS